MTFRHVIEYCNGVDADPGRRDVLGAIAEFWRAVEETDRDPGSIEVGVFGAPNDAGAIDAYREVGVARCVLGVPSAPADTVLPVLDRYVALLSQAG